MASSTWWSKNTVAVVTGSNKGIGFEIVRQFARKGITVVLTARDEQKGLAAIERLKEEKLDAHFHTLDVLSTSSVSQLASWLKKQFNGVDILINNAAIAPQPEFVKGAIEDPIYEIVKRVIESNYEGVKRVTEALLPIMKTSQAGSRIVNVSSTAGKLEYMKNPSLREEANDIEHLTQEKLDAFVQRFLEDVKAGVFEESGWPTAYPEYPGYCFSKVALNAYTRLLAKSLEHLTVGQKVYVNCLCPGYVKTDLSNNAGVLTTEQGADTPVWLALLPPSEVPMGHFFKQRQSVQF